jgi:phytoene dehydrogenase-like protein
MEKSIIIIGAGIAGLSAGCYGQMNGYRTQIYEMHDKPGGLCTSWKRNDYTIDGCLHWLLGSAPGNSFYPIWQELGVIKGRRIIYHEEFARIEGAGGRVFTVYTNIDRLEQHMRELAPQDWPLIQEFTDNLRKCTGINLPVDKAPELIGPADGVKLVARLRPFLELMDKWKGISIQDFGGRFIDPFMRWAFPLIFNIPDFPMTAALLNLAWMHQKVAGFPEGGSLQVSRAIEQRYVNFGREIFYRSSVKEIIVERGRASGIRTADGAEHRADVVISAADGHTTIFDMLHGNYTDDKIRGNYESLPLFPPLIQVALGTSYRFEGLPRLLLYRLDKKVDIAGQLQEILGVETYDFDPTLAPAGRTVVSIKLFSDYEYWSRLKLDKEKYRAEKDRIAGQVIDLLDQRFPGIKDKIEMCDVATPLTWERYTGNWRASFEGWLITTGTFGMQMSKTLPKLKNFYMAGQWVEPGGGVPAAAMSGRNVIQLICKEDKKKFKAEIER